MAKKAEITVLTVDAKGIAVVRSIVPTLERMQALVGAGGMLEGVQLDATTHAYG